jgi:WD40 repeat protein
MPDHPNQPQQYDAVFGGQTPIRAGSAILGGLEGVKRHLDSAVEEQRIAALSEALKYGEAGLDLVILALQDESEKLRRAAYLLLRERTGDGQTVVSRSADNSIRVWHVPTGQLTRTLEGHSPLYAVAISPDGQTLVSNGDEGTIQVWHLPTGQVSRILKGHSGMVNCVAISWDGQTLVSGTDEGTIQIWHLPTGELTRTLRGHSDWGLTRNWPGHSNAVRIVAISQDGQTLVSNSTDRTTKIWHLLTGKLTRTLVEDNSLAVSSVAVSPGGLTIVRAGGNDGIKVLNLSNWPIGEMTRTLGADPFHCSVVAISPDGETLVSGSTDKTIKIWHLPTGELIRTLVGHSGPVTSVAISQDGQTFVSGSSDGTIKIWGVP